MGLVRLFLKQWILFYLETILTCHVLPSETEVFPVNENMDSNEREEWVYVNGGTCPEPPEPPGTNRNPPEPPGTYPEP